MVICNSKEKLLQKATDIHHGQVYLAWKHNKLILKEVNK